jgi:hypothetical protein
MSRNRGKLMSFQVNYFQNNADLIEPGIEREPYPSFYKKLFNKPILVCQILMAISILRMKK